MLATPLRRNPRVQRDPRFVRRRNGRRQVIKTVNDQLTAQFNVGRNHAHSFAGLCARLGLSRTLDAPKSLHRQSQQPLRWSVPIHAPTSCLTQALLPSGSQVMRHAASSR
jgi:hypothetical protein